MKRVCLWTISLIWAIKPTESTGNTQMHACWHRRNMSWFITLPESVRQHLHTYKSNTYIIHFYTWQRRTNWLQMTQMKPCKAMMFSNRRRNHNFSQSYFFIILLLYRYFLIWFRARNLNLSEEYLWSGDLCQLITELPSKHGDSNID